MAVQKDRAGVVLTKGDLILVLFLNKMVDRTSERVIYKGIREKTDTEDSDAGTEQNETGTRELQYYPIDKEGLSLAKFENGDFDTRDTTGFFRKKDFVITNITNNNLLKIGTEALTGADKSYYDDIVALL